MWEALIITLAVLLLVVLSVGTFGPGQSSARSCRCRLSAGTLRPEDLIREITRNEEVLRSLKSLFNDEDYRWLKTVLPEAGRAREFRRRRIRLARRYLEAVGREFDRLQVLHDHLVRSDPAWSAGADPVADLTLGFRLRLMKARMFLPLNYLRFRLAPLEKMLGVLEGVSGRFQERLTISAASA